MGGFYRSGDISVDQTPNMKLMHILRKNGLTAWIETDAGGQDHLYVRGDRGLAYSPPREYAITPQQRQELMNAFEGSRLRKGYETFNKIVRKDFIPPESLTTAKASGINRYGVNSYTPVNMGLRQTASRRGCGRTGNRRSEGAHGWIYLQAEPRACRQPEHTAGGAGEGCAPGKAGGCPTP